MEAFDDLTERVERAWSATGYAVDVFATLAAEQLTAWFEAERAPRVDDVLAWATRSVSLPHQVDIESRFGQPPLTVAVRDRFYVDVLFWREGTTAIHEHAFAGAFAVLSGSSIHSTYRFEPSGPRTDELVLGELRLEGVEVLRPGGARTIEPGSSFVHGLFHLEHPSASIVVRTYGSRARLPQLRYRPGAAVASEPMQAGSRRRLSLLRLMLESDREGAEAAAREAVRHGDVRFAFELGIAAATLREGGALLPALREEVEARFGDAWAEGLDRAWRDERRTANLVARRAIVRDADPRTFLALLLNVPSRPELLACARALRPGQAEVDTVLDWIDGLSREPAPDAERFGPNLLGVQLPEDWREVAGRMLRGEAAEPASITEVKAELVLRHSQLLAPCFTG